MTKLERRTRAFQRSVNSTDAERQMTLSGFRFVEDYSRTTSAFLHTANLARFYDATFDPSNAGTQEFAGISYINGMQSSALDRLAMFQYVNSRNMTISTINNFLSYCAEICEECAKRDPRVLSSKSTISVADVLSHSTMDELVAAIVEKKISDLAYEGLESIEKFITDRLGITLFADDEERNRVVFLTELRNIQVHNRGIVNDTFLRRMKDKPIYGAEKGLVYYLGFAKFADFGDVLFGVVERFDTAVAEKFTLTTKSGVEWVEKQI